MRRRSEPISPTVEDIQHLAEDGNVTANYVMGLLYSQGCGVVDAVDPDISARYFREAARGWYLPSIRWLIDLLEPAGRVPEAYDGEAAFLQQHCDLLDSCEGQTGASMTQRLSSAASGYTGSSELTRT
jgi:hypothetical protein